MKDENTQRPQVRVSFAFLWIMSRMLNSTQDTPKPELLIVYSRMYHMSLPISNVYILHKVIIDVLLD